MHKLNGFNEALLLFTELFNILQQHWFVIAGSFVGLLAIILAFADMRIRFAKITEEKEDDKKAELFKKRVQIVVGFFLSIPKFFKKIFSYIATNKKGNFEVQFFFWVIVIIVLIAAAAAGYKFKSYSMKDVKCSDYELNSRVAKELFDSGEISSQTYIYELAAQSYLKDHGVPDCGNN